ncbi:MAG: endonuclease domain-containing protein [Candidatus Omnitrophota bacterium]
MTPPDKGGTGGYLPPDKGGEGGYIPYNPVLTEKARENRKNPTPAENKLWFKVLQNKRFANRKFTRQKPLDQYIVDFYCAELMLAIEIDGDSHAEQVNYDLQRTARLNQIGIDVIRYANQEVLNNPEGVYSDLFEKIKRRQQKPPKVPNPLNPQPPKSPLSGGLFMW